MLDCDVNRDLDAFKAVYVGVEVAITVPYIASEKVVLYLAINPAYTVCPPKCYDGLWLYGP